MNTLKNLISLIPSPEEAWERGQVLSHHDGWEYQAVQRLNTSISSVHRCTPRTHCKLSIGQHRGQTTGGNLELKYFFPVASQFINGKEDTLCTLTLRADEGFSRNTG